MKIEAVKNSDGGCFYKITASERASEFDIKVEYARNALPAWLYGQAVRVLKNGSEKPETAAHDFLRRHG